MQNAKSNEPEKKAPSAVVQPLVKKEEAKKVEPAKVEKTVKVKAVKKAPSKAKKKKPAQASKTTENKAKKTSTNYNFMETIMTAKTYDFDKFTKDATASSKDLFEAMQKSMNIWAKGVEQINQEAIALSQEIANKNQEAFKALIACKDINELTDVQNKLAKKNFDAIVSASTKLSEISVKVATDSFAPINDQVNKAVKKATESVAA